MERTEQEKQEWETIINNDTFLAALKDTAISITKLRDDYYNFDFRNEMGDTVASEFISRKDFPIEAFPSEENKFEKAKRIFDLARKQSLKPEQTVDRILEQLAA